MNDPADPRRAAAAAARTSYERLLAFLAARSHDLAGAEDALADAFREALERWPATGIPAAPSSRSTGRTPSGTQRDSLRSELLRRR